MGIGSAVDLEFDLAVGILVNDDLTDVGSSNTCRCLPCAIRSCGIQKVRQAAMGAREYSFNSPPSLARLLIVAPGRRIGSPRDAGGRRPQLR
jgi:hypothetical protein